MPPKVRISLQVISKLKSLRYPITGRLFGVMYDNYLTILSFVLNPKPQPNQNQNINEEGEDSERCKEKNNAIMPADLQLNMPAEIDLCGVLFVEESEEKIPDAFTDIDVTDNPLLIKYSRNNGISAFYYIHEQLKCAGKLEFIDTELFEDKFSYIRLKTVIPIITEKSDFTEIFQSTRKNIASGAVGFYFPQSNTFLMDNDSDSRELSMLKSLNNSTKYSGFINVIDVNMFMRITNENNPEDVQKYAPVVQHIKLPFESYHFNLNIDTLSLIGHNITATQVYSILVESVCRSLRLIERSIMEQINENKNVLRVPEVLHFKLPSFDHLFTIAYSDISSEKTKDYRKNLHNVFALDLSRPYFRKGNAVRFSSDFKSNEPLIEPHIAIKSHLGTNSSLVSGLYSYYHYEQDNFNDSGWGCAYRSLQTIFSWFKLQGYTDKPIPSHRDIQKCLVDIGDKAPKFIGSNQWIGSTEVGFVLEILLNISVKVLCASNGKDMPNLIDDLREHFDNQGTPVMIGGGVLAHTILGVSYDEENKQPYWLILDPHYEGSDNLNEVITKGMCAWKGKEFWRKDAFYNMCLPQRPYCY
ncbi:ufm1-specific protease 2-like [Chelonus insularis]|uniref:ufm1-specific protease 2-like n=1 Tax=Chelonus insularis TaxID=460826 RepID=UPI00158ADBE2|nr:ufm1-specific protease 2-like [Chelonus insularis]